MALKIESYNRTSEGRFTQVNFSEKYPFVKVKQLDLSKTYQLLAIRVIDQPKNAYGDSVFVTVRGGIGEEIINVDLPKSAKLICQNLIDDDEAVKEINDGKAGIKFSMYYNEKYKKDNCTSYHFCEFIPF